MTAHRGVALVTGAGSGIGRAIAVALLNTRFDVVLAGRRRDVLEATAAMANGGRPRVLPTDLTDDASLAALCAEVTQLGRLDVLVHSAALYAGGRVETAPVADFDAQYAANVRAPYVLTQRLLPLLKSATGQVIFINSTAVGGKMQEHSQYAATKHALQALADSLRSEVNRDGIRVLSVYVGRTATPMQERVAEREGHPYRPERLLQPSDVAATVIHALSLPRTAEITDLTIRQMLPRD